MLYCIVLCCAVHYTPMMARGNIASIQILPKNFKNRLAKNQKTGFHSDCLKLHVILYGSLEIVYHCHYQQSKAKQFTYHIVSYRIVVSLIASITVISAKVLWDGLLHLSVISFYVR